MWLKIICLIRGIMFLKVFFIWYFEFVYVWSKLVMIDKFYGCLNRGYGKIYRFFDIDCEDNN